MSKFLPENLPSVMTGFGQGSYPAGSDPWAGQPTGVQPVDPFFTPGVAPPAEYPSYMHGRQAIMSQALMDAVSALFVANWPNWTPTEDSQMNADYARIGGAGYLPTTGQCSWLIMGGQAALPTSGTNTMTVLQSVDGGRTFLGLNFPSTGMTAHSGDGVLDGIAGDSTGGVLVTATDFTTVPAIKLMALYSGTWHSASPAYAGTFPTSVHWDAAANVYVYGDVTGLYTLPVGSTTPTAHAFSGAPSGVASVLTSRIIPKGDGSGVVVPATQTGTPWQHCAAYSAPTTTSPTYGTFPMANTDTIVGGDYSASDGLYMVAKYTGSNTQFMVSGDGVTWTTTASPILGQAKGLACLAGKIWVAPRADGLLFYSTDAGGSWSACSCEFAGDINQMNGFMANPLKTQMAMFGSFSYKNQSTPTESRMMITSLSIG